MFRRYFLAGLLVLVPILATFFIIKFMVDLVDRSLLLLPHQLQPDQVFGVHIPGLGLLFTLILVFITGMLVTNFFGRWVFTVGESFLNRIPLVRSIYSGVKQILNTVLASSGEAFRKVLLIEYPRKGIWTIAFQTGSGFVLPNSPEGLVSVYVPTTPNPTSGFLLLLPRKDIIELNISIEQGLKLVISLGVVLPPDMVDKMLHNHTKESI
jgi:uncharacterized membrane protein